MGTLSVMLQIGGPLFTLAAFVIWLGSKHVGKLIDLISNHMTHVEKAMVESTTSNEAIVAVIDRLITRIDSLLIHGHHD